MVSFQKFQHVLLEVMLHTPNHSHISHLHNVCIMHGKSCGVFLSLEIFNLIVTNVRFLIKTYVGNKLIFYCFVFCFFPPCY